MVLVPPAALKQAVGEKKNIKEWQPTKRIWNFEFRYMVTEKKNGESYNSSRVLAVALDQKVFRKQQC
jgi:hypothetical protein